MNVRVRNALSSFALAATVTALVASLPAAPSWACDKSQCPLTVSTEPTGPAPQPLAAGEAPAAAAQPPMKLERFRRSASGKSYRSSSKKVASGKASRRSLVAQRAKAGQRRAVAARAETGDEVTPAATQKPASAVALPAAATLASAEAVPLGAGAPEVKVVSPDEVNEIDLAAAPAPAAETSIVTATPVPAEPARAAVETTGRASSLDSIQREIHQVASADKPASGDEAWVQKMLLVLGGAFAAAAAAARLLLTA